MPELERFDIAKYFEYILFSSDMRLSKPNPKIFLGALGHMKLSPEDAVYVGDDLSIDIVGAKLAGMKTVWIEHCPASKPAAGFSPDAKVKAGSCRDLAGILPALM